MGIVSGNLHLQALPPQRKPWPPLHGVRCARHSITSRPWDSQPRKSTVTHQRLQRPREMGAACSHMADTIII